MQNKVLINWLIFTILSFIWGSSFILMKEGLIGLSSYQVASLRIVFSGLVLLPYAIKGWKQISKEKIVIIFLSGLLGSLLPAFLFCIAEEKIDSALAGTLNSLTPIFVIAIGAIFFSTKTTTNKIIGIVIAIVGCAFLLFSKGGVQSNQHFGYIFLVIIATICYGINVNMVNKHLQNIGSIQIAAIALGLNGVVALVILFFTGYFYLPLADTKVLSSTFFTAILGIFGTALASVIFYVLMKRAGAIFASMVTYGIPFVAIMWGVVYGENITAKQIIALLIILLGVFIANKNKAVK
jgi:drug/metabolite transporter (DMT)-like permease